MIHCNGVIEKEEYVKDVHQHKIWKEQEIAHWLQRWGVIKFIQLIE